MLGSVACSSPKINSLHTMVIYVVSQKLLIVYRYFTVDASDPHIRHEHDHDIVSGFALLTAFIVG